MDIQAYRDEIKLRLSGNLLNIEIEDSAIDGCINSAFRQVQRYMDSTKIITIPYSRCIDMTQYKVSSVSRVFRAQGYLFSNGQVQGPQADPMYMASWQMMSGTGAGFSQMNTWSQNYAAYNTALQIRNTMSTDLAYRYDKSDNKLYINCAFDFPKYITVEYVPKLDSVEEIVSDYWIDIVARLSVAICKQVIGRIRKKFTQTNALWELDVDILQEGIDEEKEIQEQLRLASQLTYGID